jgi:molybdopterin synthase catalytic subunit
MRRIPASLFAFVQTRYVMAGMPAPLLFSISSEPLALTALKTALGDTHAGACVIFEGWVRDHNDGQPVRSLEYEAYPALAEKEGLRILAEAAEKFAITAACCVHRTGHLQPGELAVWTGVSSPHRDASFAACRYIIDETKARVPIWKKEHYASGATAWINCATRGEFADQGR